VEAFVLVGDEKRSILVDRRLPTLATAGSLSAARLPAVDTNLQKTSPQAVERIARFLLNKSGICITKENAYLIDTRLSRVARLHKLESVERLSIDLESPASSVLAKDVIEAMTTNETLFFRDGRPFVSLRKLVLPKIRESKKLSPIRIYSAAASTGQEAYSIAMSLDDEMGAIGKFAFEIVGTDIDSQVIEKAQKGSYNQFEVQRGVPAQFLVRYFDKVGEQWIVKQSLRSSVRFQQFNLLHEMSSLGRFDVIFCRNVLIYFDSTTKADIVKRLASILQSGGYLFLGSSEYLSSSGKVLAAVDGIPGLYQRIG
jgi:chemotaxis protein methyltransferase CheR